MATVCPPEQATGIRHIECLRGFALKNCESNGGIPIADGLLVKTLPRPARALLAAAVSFPLVFLTSCQSTDDVTAVQVVEGPELDIGLSTDLAIPQDIDSIRIERTVHEISARAISTEEHELGPTDLQLPTMLRFSGLSQPQGYHSVGVRVVAWKGATPVVFAEGVFTMPDAGVALVSLLLEARCAGQVKMLADSSLTSSCPDFQTCRAGRCESIDRRSESMQPDGGTAGAPGDATAGSAGESNP